MGATEVNINEGDSYTIKKPITIKNGNVKGGTFIVERSGVRFENLNKIDAVTVDEKVGSGDFSIKGCHEVGNLWVNGGGSNSIHIAASTIGCLVVNKPLVRIALDEDAAGNVSITHAIISQECKIESESGNTLENVIVAKAEAKVTLAGTMSITNLVNEANAEVEKTGNATIANQNANLGDAKIEKTLIEKIISDLNEKLSPNTSIVKQELPKAPKDLKLSSKPCNDGILIDIENPPAVTEEPADYFMSVFIDGIGNVTQTYYAKDYIPNKFFFPYVQAGKTYKVRVWFWRELKDENNNTIPNSGKDLSWGEIDVTADGGKGGDLMLVSPQEITSVDAKGNFKLKAPEFAQEPSGFDWKITIEPYSGKSWNVENSPGWKWLGVMYVPKSEINDTHNIYECMGYHSEDPIDFINAFISSIESYGDETYEYRWPAAPKDDMQPLPPITLEQYSKLDPTPLTIKAIEERCPIIDDENAKEDGVYMFTYPFAAKVTSAKSEWATIIR